MDLLKSETSKICDFFLNTLYMLANTCWKHEKTVNCVVLKCGVRLFNRFVLFARQHTGAVLNITLQLIRLTFELMVSVSLLSPTLSVVILLRSTSSLSLNRDVYSYLLDWKNLVIQTQAKQLSLTDLLVFLDESATQPGSSYCSLLWVCALC